MIMKTFLKNISVTVFACFISLLGTVNADELDTASTILFTGADTRDEAGYIWVGAIHHFSGDILSDGLVARTLAFHSNYEYSTDFEDTDADANSINLMFGYQKVMNIFTARGYLGLEYEDHKFSPDNTFDKNRGGDAGVRVRGELETDFSSPNYGSLIASYGSAKDRYWSQLRAGREFSGFVVGPEAVFLGDQEYNEQRFGVFVTVRKLIPVLFSTSIGYANPDTDRGKSGAYLDVEISKTF